MPTVKTTRPKTAVGRAWNRQQDICAVVTLVLVALKLAGVITWSWWWVLAPLYPAFLVMTLALCAALVLLAVHLARPRLA